MTKSLQDQLTEISKVARDRLNEKEAVLKRLDIAKAALMEISASSIAPISIKALADTTLKRITIEKPPVVKTVTEKAVAAKAVTRAKAEEKFRVSGVIGHVRKREKRSGGALF